MDRTKLGKLISDKNERLEDAALSRASQLIEEIAHEQKRIVQANERIEQLRKDLSALEVEQLDPTAILGK